MLEYEKQIFLDILQEDGLVIAAKGLGLDSVIVNLLKVYCDPGNLVFVLGAEGKLQEWLLKRLKATAVTPEPRVLSSETGSNEREQLYLEGGLWFVPPRILIVDMIKKQLPIDLITGIIVCKAHNILKNHLDSFVLRLYREGNKTGFIKAFSDQAPAFKGGFNKVEQIMKALFVRNLLLWPRYHAAVKSSLNQCKATVIELHLEMTKNMLQLQNALLDLIKLTVHELKRLNPLLNTEEVTVENAISDTLHKTLHSQLDPVWHALSERTKTLLADLKLFHYMILSLLTVDSISFYAFVNSQRKSECALKGSGWHFSPPAEILFTTSRLRVFANEESDPSDQSQVDAEPNPKWLVLSEILSEIHKEHTKVEIKTTKIDTQNKDIEEKLSDLFGIENKTETSLNKNDNEFSADILILTKTERNCAQLQMYLTLGGNELLASQYRKFILNRIGMIKPNIESTEIQADKGDDEKNVHEKPEVEDLEADTYVLSLSDIGISKLEETDRKINVAGYFEDFLSESQKSSLLNEETMHSQSMHNIKKPPPVIVIKSYNKNLITMPQLLEEQKPKWVIIYDIEMTLVRQLEVYQRNNPDIPVKVYFLVFGGTIEEQAYLTSLRKEKEAFDFLIEEKARVVIPSDWNDYPEFCRESAAASDLSNKTRKGGLESVSKMPSKIIVDMREFRSELPALIHSRGINIEPYTITIGDYVLTPDICLERKSISDLIQSLNSGRLYNQALAMTRHYSRPMLLIEFDKDKPFDIQDRYYLSTDASSDNLITKLQLLTLHFPQLRLIWSPNPMATAQLFEELKQGHPEPDIAVASKLGVEENATDEDKFNPGVQKFLSNLPGVTNKNIILLLLKGKSLDNLKNLSKEEISDLIQNSTEAEILYDSIHKKFQPDESSSSINSNKGKLKLGLGKGKKKKFH